MPDLSSSTWSETDASNDAPPPNGWPEGQSPSSVNDCARMMMGAVKRFWDRINGTSAAGGAGNALTLTYAVAPTAYAVGEVYSFKATAANTGAATLNVNGLGPKSICKPGSAGPTPLTGGEIQAGQIVTAVYDGTQFAMTSPAANLGAVTSVAIAGAANSGVAVIGSPITSTGTIGLSLDPNDLASKATPAATDHVVINDVSGGNVAKKVTIASAVGAVGKVWLPGVAVSMNPIATNRRVQSVHGLGQIPDRVLVYIECLATEAGYAVGDRIFVEGSSFVLAGANIIITTSANSTILTVSISNNSLPAISPNSVTPGGVTTSIAAANWKIVAVPYKLI